MPEKIFERLTDASGVYFDGDLVMRRQTPFQLLEVYETAQRRRVTMRIAAFMVAIRRVTEASEMRGLYA